MYGRNGNWSNRTWSRVDNRSVSPYRRSRSRSMDRYSISPLRIESGERLSNRSPRNRSRERHNFSVRQGFSRQSSSRSPRRNRILEGRERAQASPRRSEATPLGQQQRGLEVVKVVRNQEIIVHSRDNPYDIDEDNHVEYNQHQYSPPPPPADLDFGFHPNGENDERQSEDSDVKEDLCFDDYLKTFTEIPVFDPATSSFTSKQWLKIVDNVTKNQGLSKQEKKYAMSAKLAGAAKQWYITVNKPDTSYYTIHRQFIQAFRSDLDYYNSLKKMMSRNKQPNESYASYFDDKTTMLDVCELTGRKAISCLIGGLSDASVKNMCYRQNFIEISELYEFLRKQELQEKEGKQPEKKNNPQNTQPQRQQPPPNQQLPSKKTRPRVRKPTPASATKRLRRRRCMRCRSRAHEAADCPVAEDDLPLQRVMYGQLGSVPTQKRYYTSVLVNGNTLRAYIDASSEHTTIRQEVAQRCNIVSMAPLASVGGFNGSFLPALGQSRATISVDETIAVVTVCIVPNDVQAIPLILGRSFINQPDIMMIDNANGVRILQRRESQVTYQSAPLLYQNLGQVPYTPFNN